MERFCLPSSQLRMSISTSQLRTRLPGSYTSRPDQASLSVFLQLVQNKNASTPKIKLGGRLLGAPFRLQGARSRQAG